jgi:predicted DNA repair protein MutK
MTCAVRVCVFRSYIPFRHSYKDFTVAGASLITLIDDIASILDDVSLMTKVAAKKTAGVLGDDLALNAQQVSGVNADRELPVVWAVAKGSIKNKMILVPAALAISAFAPWAVTPLLMLGGAFLCYEGFEKLAHKFLHSKSEDEGHRAEHRKTVTASNVDPAAMEKEKIKGAVRTDFILSAEIISIALGTVADAPFTQQVVVLVGIAAIMTVGVYGLVGGIVKLDDLGLYLTKSRAAIQQQIGHAILAAAPYMMKTLSVVGTAAMFMVGGGILTHGFHAAQEWIEHAADAAAEIPVIGGLAAALTPAVLSALAGVVAGAIVVAVVTLIRRMTGKTEPGH